MEVIADLAVRMARENPRWGYTRIQGALYNVGHRVGRTTVADILKRTESIPLQNEASERRGVSFSRPTGTCSPPPTSSPSRSGDRVVSSRSTCSFVIELATRRIEIAGITTGPSEIWMMQIGRNLTDPFDGFLADKRYLILDRDSRFSAAFRDLLEDSGVEIVRLPARSPNLMPTPSGSCVPSKRSVSAA